MITRQDVPCWYDLSWKENSGVIVRIHQDAAATCEMPHKESPIMKHLRSEHKTDFMARLGEDFGVAGALKCLGHSGEFLEYQVPIVLCRKHAGKCRMCSGTAEWNGSDCLFCDRTGENYEYDYFEAIRVSTSLGALLNFLSFPVPTTSSLPQLVALSTSMSKDTFYVGGEFSVAMVKYLRSRPDGPIPEMEAAMISVSQKMEGRTHDAHDLLTRFRTDLRSGSRLNVTCPGDACGLNPHHNYSSQDLRGYMFSDHNVDQPMQQMMLIASVAALHDLARAAKF